VPADREFLSRALANLIDNALKYGGSTITVATRAAEDWGEIIVSDDGPGIPEQDRARVVERFVRLDNARTRTGAGWARHGRRRRAAPWRRTGAVR
jgi:signal transduction histidine kinase